MTSSDIIWNLVELKAHKLHLAPATNTKLVRDLSIELDTLCETYAAVEHPGDLIPEFRAMYRAQALNYAERKAA
jgi:succinate dehydrogenase/fumarate reductase-like Fe-S protein